MKKSLIALAVLAAAGAASAQSSVTLFGIVDATLERVSNKGGGSVTRVTSSGESTSRLGFRGTEDLGAGMSASFWLEAGLQNADGQGQATNSNNQVSGTGAGVAGRQGLTFNRRATVSLGGGFGEIRIGRDYNPAFWNLTVFDPYGTVGVGATQTLNSILNFPTAVRTSNTIGYFLPGDLGGFYGQAQIYRGGNSSALGGVGNPSNPASSDGNGAAVRVGYSAGPLNVALASARTKYSLTAPGATLGTTRQSNLGASWNFGVATLMGQVTRDTAETLAGNARGRGYLLGATAPVGAGVIKASYSQYTLGAPAAAGTTDPRAKKFALGYVHNLSKRTAVYTTLARVRNNGTSSASVFPGVAAGGAAGSSSTGYDLGIRHSF
ncbi:MAG: porin [Ramlibacter sp.]